MENLFYIQDTTKTENGQVYWWKKNSFGHTSDLKKAETYTLKQAMSFVDLINRRVKEESYIFSTTIRNSVWSDDKHFKEHVKRLENGS